MMRLIILWMLLILQPLFSADTRTVKLTENFLALEITSHLSYCNCDLTLAELTSLNRDWLPVTNPIIPEYKPGGKIWLRAKLQNNSTKPIRVYLVSGEARTDKISFAYFGSGRLVSEASAGDLTNRRDRPEYLTATFPLYMSPGESGDIYISLSNPVDVAADFILVESSVFAERAGSQYLLHGIFFGALIALTLYYGAVFFSTGAREVGDYLVYLFVIIVFFAARTGLLFQGIGFHAAELMNLCVTSLPALVFFAGLRFSRSFLEIDRLPRLNKALLLLQYALLIPIPVAFFSRSVARDMCDWISMILGPGFLIAALLLIKRLPKARLYVIGWSIPLIVSTAQNFGIDTSYAMRNTLLQGAVLIEFVWFAIFVSWDISTIERGRREQRLRLESVEADIREARKVHATLLPDGPPDFPGLQMEVLYRPMSELGGDYYNWQRLADGRLAVLVADVTGHGLPAALDAAVVSIAFQTAAEDAVSANGILAAMNGKLIAQGIDRCVSAVCAIYSSGLGELEISLAGHPQGIILKSKGNIELVGEFAPLLGFSAKSEYRSSYARLERRDLVILCTDGVYEIPSAVDIDDFDKLSQVMLAERNEQPRLLIENVVRYYDSLRGAVQTDDITILAMRV